MMKRLLLFFLLIVSAASAQTSSNGRVMTGAAATRPAACTSSDIWTDTDTPNSYKCYPDNVWNLLGNGPLTYTDVAFNATPTFSSLTNSAWHMLLTGNVTSSTFTTSGAAGTIFQFDFQEDGVGGRTFAFPGNVNVPTGFVFDTAANHHNQLAFIWNGTTWNPWQVIGSGGGSGTPASPLNSLQKNLSGAFGSTNLSESGTTLTVDDNINPKGANPYFDIMRYGGYVADSTNLQTMTCTIAASSTSLGCTTNPDFQNGQGIVIPLAGAGPTDIPTAPTGTATPFGVTNGVTTYCYKYVLENYFGALTAAGTSFCTSVGAATLGVNTVAVSNVSRVSGVDTYTCGTNCNVSISAQVQLSGFSGGGAGFQNGTVVVASTPDATHFTALSSGASDTGESASATMSVKACNRLFPSGTLGVESRILRTWIYRQDAGVGNFNLKGVAPGQDPYFEDCNQGVNGPVNVPTTAPAASQVGYLATVIDAGGGTTNMTTHVAATTTSTSQVVQHDNSSAVIAAWTAAYAAHGGVVYIPVIPGGGFLQFPFNSTMDLTAISNPTNSTVKLMVSNAALNQPWILARSSEIEGIAQTATSFQYTPLGSIAGGAQPLLLANNRSVGGIKISKIKFGTFAIGQSSIVLDQKVTGGGEVGFIFEDNGYSGISAPAVLIKGGFDFWFTHGVCSLSDPNGGWGARPCVELTSASSYLSGVSTQVPGRIWFDHTNFSSGVGISINNIPGSNQVPSFTNGGADLFIHNTLFESVAAMPLRISYLNGSFGASVGIDDLEMADQVNGLRTPMIDMTDSTNFANVEIRNSKSLPGSITLAGGYSGVAAPLCSNNLFSAGCGKSPNQILLGATHIVDGAVVSAINGGSMGYSMPTPPAPASCVVSAGGSVPINAGITYGIAWTDRTPASIGPYAGVSLVGPACSVATSSGQQTVTVTRPAAPPVGAIGWLAYRGSSGGGTSLAAISPCGTPIPISTTTFVDTFSFTCGASSPQLNTALQSGINSSGMNASKFTGGGFAAVPTSTKTSAYTATANDNIIPVDATGGNVTISLNPAITGSHWTITRLDSSANTVSITPTSGLIDGVGNLTVLGNTSAIVTCLGGTNCQSESKSSAGGSGTINNASQFAQPYYSGSGSNNIISGVAPPTVNGTYFEGYQVVASAAVAPTTFLLGSNYNSQTGSTYTLGTVATDRAGVVDMNSTTTSTVTLPAISGALASNYVTRIRNSNSGNMTITSTAPNTIDGGSAGGSINILPGWLAILNQDTSPNWFSTRIPTFTAFPACTDTSGQHLNLAATGFVCGTSTIPIFYQQVGNNGTTQTARNRLNFIPGTNVTFSFADNGGTNSTDVTINASSSAGNPCTTTALSLQFNNGGAFGCLAEWTYTTSILTGSAAAKFDMSAANTTTAFKIPAFAGATQTAAGFDYDTTNKNVHTFSNGADAINVAIPSAPANGNVADWSVASSVVQAHDSGIATANVVTAAAAATAAGQLAFSTSNNKALSFAPLAPATLTDGATVTYALSNNPAANAVLTFTVHSGSRTMNITNPVSGGTYLVRLVQDGTGGENLTGGTGCTWKQLGGGGSTFTLTASANAVDILTFYYDGTTCWANLGKAYN